MPLSKEMQDYLTLDNHLLDFQCRKTLRMFLSLNIKLKHNCITKMTNKHVSCKGSLEFPLFSDSKSDFISLYSYLKT